MDSPTFLAKLLSGKSLVFWNPYSTSISQKSAAHESQINYIRPLAEIRVKIYHIALEPLVYKGF